MQITIQVDNGETVTKLSTCARLKKLLCHLSVQNLLALFLTVAFLFGTLILCETYVKDVLVWLENQDSVIIIGTVVVLYCIFSLPIVLGYIMLVIADGYLFGFVNGMMLTMIGANIGLLVAHYILKLISHTKRIQRMVDNDTARAIMRVISGPLCFKIVFCARVTPIPFGVQNSIFAISNVNGKIYHTATFLGLLLPQSVAVYIGTTLRSMQDVVESRNISTGTYVFAISQLVFGLFIMFWIGAKARTELVKVLAEGESKLLPSEKSVSTLNLSAV